MDSARFSGASSLLLKSVMAMLLLIVSVCATATSISSTAAGGNWSAPATWMGGVVPGSGDVVTIIGGATVIIDVNTASCASLQLNATGNNKIASVQFIAGGAGVLTVGGNVALGGTASGNAGTKNTLVMTNGGILICTGFAIGPVAGSNTFTPGAGTVQLTGTNSLPATIFTSFNNLQIISGTTTTGSNVTANGALSVANGATFATASTFTLSIAGTTTVNGNLFLAGTGTKTFTGDVTINAGGSWNETGVSAINQAGNLQNDGTYTANTGTHTFSGTAKAIGGATAIVIPALTITGSRTNNGTLTVGTALAGSGSLTNSAAGVLNLAGTTTITTLTATAAGNIVNYTGTTQIVKGTGYYTLNLSGGAKTFSAATTIAADLVLSGSATATTATTMSIAGNLVIGDGTTFTAGGGAFTVTGTTTVGGGASGVFNFSSASGTKTFTGDVTVNAGATWNETAAAVVNFAGNLINNAATFTTSTGAHTFAGTNKTIGGATATSIGNMTVTGSYTASGAITVRTALNIASGAVFSTASTFAFAVNGTASVTGSLLLDGTANKTFVGNVTINAAAVWNETGSGAVSFAGNLVNNGNFTASNAVHTFTGITKTISGAGVIAIDNLTINGVVTNSAKLTVSSALAGIGTLSNAAAGVLTLGGTAAITGLTATATSNTVIYSGAAQTVHANNYYNLILSGSGIKTLATATTAISGSLTLSGTASATTVAALTIGASLIIGDGTSFTVGAFAVTVTGATTIGNGTSGNLIFSSATGAKLFTGLVTVAAGGTWNNTSGAAVTFRNGIVNNGSFTAGNGIHSFTTNAQSLTGILSIPSVTITTITVTNNNTLTVATALIGTGRLVQAVNAVLNIGGTATITGLTATANPNYVNYTGAAQSVKAVAYNFLSLSGSGAKSILAGTSTTATLAISGTATASIAALLNINVASLSLGGSNKINGTWGSTSSAATNKNNTWFALTSGFCTVSFDSRPVPVFSGLAATTTIAYGTATVTLSGNLSAAGPIYPANGETIGVTINGTTQTTTIAGTTGSFSISFSTATIPASSTPYTITYAYSGNSSLAVSSDNATVLTVSGVSQAIASFRSSASGNFSDIATWEYDQGGNSWIAASQIPQSTNSVSISHAVTLDVAFTAGANTLFKIASGGSLNVNPGITLKVDALGTINFNDQPVTVVSNAAGTGSIGVIAGTLTGASNVTVERYIGTDKRAWRLLTIPVTGISIRDAWANGPATNPNAAVNIEAAGNGTLITGNGYTSGTTANSNGFDWFTGLGTVSTSSIRSYNPSNSWASANTPDPRNAPAEQGYMLYVRGDRTVAASSGSGITTLRPTGTLKQGTQNISIGSNPFAVVGNPYASSIDLATLYNNNTAAIDPAFYVWDATQGTSGAYITIIGDPFGNYITTMGDDAMPYLTVNSGQAFFVVPKSGGTGAVTINETTKTSNTPTLGFRPMSPVVGASKLAIKLYQATGSTLGQLIDGTTARFSDNYSVSPTEVYDATKLYNFNENISLLRNNRYLSVESRPFPAKKDSLFVPFWNLRQRDYALTIASSNFAGINQTAVLIDKFTNTQKIIDLSNATTVYPFSVTSNAASSSLSRFIIVLNPSTPLAVNFTKISAGVDGSTVQVKWSTANESGIKNYVVERSEDGTGFTPVNSVSATNLATGASYAWTDEHPLAGNNYYRIRGNDESGKITYSNIASAKLAVKQAISVMPTVVTDKQFKVSFTGKPAGSYGLVLTNAEGQQVYQATIVNTGSHYQQNISLQNTALTSGMYNVTVTGADGTSQNYRIVINN